VVGRQVFDALSPLGWDTTLLFLRHVLAGGGSAFLEVALDGPERRDTWTDYRYVDPDRLATQLARYGLASEHLEASVQDEGGSTVSRMIVRSTPR
jgi:hypothetical protein